MEEQAPKALALAVRLMAASETRRPAERPGPNRKARRAAKSRKRRSK